MIAASVGVAGVEGSSELSRTMCRAASVSAAPTRVCWKSSGVYQDHRGEALIGLIGAHGDAFELLEPKKFAGGWFIEPQAQLVYQNINRQLCAGRDAGGDRVPAHDVLA